MTDFQIVDEKSASTAEISGIGEQYVAPRYYSDSYYLSVNLADTAFEVIPAKSGKKFIITSLIFASSKTFGSATTAETLTLYEASPADIDASLKIFTQIDLLKNDRLVATGLNLATSTAVSLIASATDTNVNVTIAGYYVPTSC
jgi:hypothetical protein